MQHKQTENYKKKLIRHKKVDSNYLRKKKYSEADSNINDLINDFILHYYPSKNNQNLLMLQVTSPTLSIDEIKKTLQFIKKNNSKSLMHVCNVIESPYEIIEKSDDIVKTDKLKFFFQSFLKGEKKLTYKLWTIIMFKSWKNLFFS